MFNFSYDQIEQQQTLATVIKLETLSECWLFNTFISDANKLLSLDFFPYIPLTLARNPSASSKQNK